MPDLFYKPPAQPLLDRVGQKGFFIRPEDIPFYAEYGTYNPLLVLLSYLIVVVAAYVALGVAANLTGPGLRSRRIKLVCGAFAMGAGIWSMHFIGMLAYEMDMKLAYTPWITALSMAVAVIFAGTAFAIVRKEKLTWKTIAIAAPVMGLAVCGMHYIGMGAMEMDASLHYTPGLFFLSFVIAAGASFGALWLMFHSRNSKHPVLYKLGAAMVMGVAVCGMHYTGMAASVFLPYADCRYGENDFTGLAFAITLITLLILSVAYLVKQLDEALAEAQARTLQLMQAQKMEAVGQLTGGIAHDFNNILAVLQGNMELLERVVPPDPKTAGFIRAALESVDKARDLTQRLLAFSRKQVLKPEPTDVNRLVSGMLSYTSRTLGTQIEISAELMPESPVVIVDAAQLETALLNLMINARDAMQGGGHLTIKTSLKSFDRADVTDMELPPGDYVAVEVIDTGQGMTPEILARATEPFFTTKDVGRGSGMGLSMVQGFARQSGGDVRLESSPGGGTTVTICLPAVMAEAGPAERKHRSALGRAEEPREAPGGSEHILVVDDEEQIRILLVKTLSSLGYTVTAAASGPDALDVLDATPDISAIVTDIAMPGGMSGYKMAEQAMARRPGIGVVFISGYAQEHTPSEALKGTNYAFLHKPYSMTDIAHAIRRVIEGGGGKD